MDYSPPGLSVHGILQARILEWVAICFSGDLPDPGIEPGVSALAGRVFTTELPGKPICFLAKTKLKKTGLWVPVFTGDLSWGWTAAPCPRSSPTPSSYLLPFQGPCWWPIPTRPATQTWKNCLGNFCVFPNFKFQGKPVEKLGKQEQNYYSPLRMKTLQVTQRCYCSEGIHWSVMEHECRRCWHTQSKVKGDSFGNQDRNTRKKSSDD